MRTVNFRDQVVYALAYKMGLDPVNDLLTDQATAFVSFINTWVRKLYPQFDWPEWTLIEQRTPVSHYVDFAQASLNVIGRVLKVYLRDPATTQAVLDTPFKLDANGVFVGFEHGTNVWIKYIKSAPQYTSTPYSAATTYAKDALAYDPTSGNVYISLVAGNIGQLLTDASKWAVVPFPEQLADMVVRGAYADALREEGQTDKGQEEEQAIAIDAVLKTGIQAAPNYAPLTDQTKPAPRYRAPSAST